MPTKREFEEIDRIVDDCIEDKGKAATLKRALHAKSDKEVAKEESAQADDDLWDNLPV